MFSAKIKLTLKNNFICISYFTSNLSASVFVPPLHIAFLQVRLLARIQSIHPSPSIREQHTSIHGHHRSCKDDSTHRLNTTHSNRIKQQQRNIELAGLEILIIAHAEMDSDDHYNFNIQQPKRRIRANLTFRQPQHHFRLQDKRHRLTGHSTHLLHRFVTINLFQKWPRKPRVPSVRPSTTLSLVNTPFTCTSTSTAGKYLPTNFFPRPAHKDKEYDFPVDNFGTTPELTGRCESCLYWTLLLFCWKTPQTTASRDTT